MADFYCYADMNLEAVVNATHDFYYDNLLGSFSIDLNDTAGGEAVTWTGGSGKLWGDNGTDTMIIEVTSGTAPTDGAQITGSTSSATCDVNGSVAAFSAMTDGDNLEIQAGAVVKCTKTPPVLIGAVDIDHGELFVDGLSIDSGNSINFVGEWGEALSVNAQGTFRVEGDWYSIGTTNGTSGQTFNLATFYNSSFCVAWLPMIQVETGRRIDFDSPSGTAPEVGDFVRKVSDVTIFGRIVEVGTTYLVVKYLTGTLVNNDEIEVEKLVDNNGPDLQISWTADVNNASGDIKETGVYQEFGNVNTNGTSYVADFGDGPGGFVFSNDFQSTTLTMASSSGGFIPPSGCNVRVPNVVFTCSDVTNYGSNSTYNDGGASTNSWYGLDTGLGGEVYLDTCNFGGVTVVSSSSYVYVATLVGVALAIGGEESLSKVVIDRCVITSSPTGLITTRNGLSCLSVDSGAEITDCLFVTTQLGVCMVAIYNIPGVIVTGNIISNSASLSTWTYGNYLLLIDRCANGYIDSNILVHGENTESDDLVLLSLCENVVLRNTMVSVTQDYSSYDNRFITNSASNGTYVVGVIFLGGNTSGGFPSSAFGNLTNNSSTVDFKVRCIGRIDDKVSLGTDNPEAWFLGYTDAYGFDISRVWKSGLNTSRMLVYQSSHVGCSMVNCSMNYTAYGWLDPWGKNNRYKGFHYSDIIRTNSETYGYNFHDGFSSDTAGVIICIGIPPSSAVNNVTIVSGNPLFWKNGLFTMNDGDEMIFEQDYFCLGHLAFSGTCNTYNQYSGATTWSNVTVTFQYDIGSGWNGSWLDIGTSSNWTGITGIADGVKLKYRLVASGMQSNMSMIEAATTTTLATQAANLYPIDQNEVEIEVTVKKLEDSSLLEGVVVYLVAGAGGPIAEGTELLNGLTDSSGVARTTLLYTDDQPITGRVRSASGPEPFSPFSIDGTITNNGFTLTALLVGDE